MYSSCSWRAPTRPAMAAIAGPSLSLDRTSYCPGGVRCVTKRCACRRVIHAIMWKMNAGGHIQTLNWMLEQSPPCPVDICTIAFAGSDNPGALEEIHDCLLVHGAKISTQDLSEMAVDCTVLQRHQDNGAIDLPWPSWPDTCSEAQSIIQDLAHATNGLWQMAYFFNKTRHLFETSMDIDLLASLLPWCNKEDVKEVLGRVYSAKAVYALMLSSIKEGDLEMFQWLHAVATQSTATDLHLPGNAVWMGDPFYNGPRVLDDGLRYIDGSSIYAEVAAFCGELAHLCFIFQYQPQFKWSPKLLRIAASRGHVHVLTRAQSPVCPWGESRQWKALSLPCAVFLERNSKPLTKSSMNALNRARRTTLACCLKRKGFHATLVCHVLSLT